MNRWRRRVATACGAAAGLFLVAMMLLRPEGLFPSRRRRRELHTEEDEAFAETGDPMGGSPE